MPFNLSIAQLLLTLREWIIVTITSFVPDSPALGLLKKVLIHSTNVVETISVVINLYCALQGEPEIQARHVVDPGEPPRINVMDFGEFYAEEIIQRMRDMV
ncbi:hypothetical protein K439DRAFT_1624714 [Ramaria rubella]|nr:hypothetical protein K439DRAFT_1624714 [Ramaria rubella]